MAATPVTITTIDVAQAIADEMNAPTLGTVFELAFDCARMRLPIFDSAKLKTKLQIAVIPFKEKRGSWTRGGTERTHTVKLCFQRTLDPTSATYEADLDAHGYMVFQTEDYWMAAARRKLASVNTPNVYIMDSEVICFQNPKAGEEKGTFAALMDLTLVERTRQ